MVTRQLYEYEVNLHNPHNESATQETVKFYTYWSPIKRTMLEIAEACAAQETCTSGLARATKREQSLIPLNPAELITPYIFPAKLEEIEE